VSSRTWRHLISRRTGAIIESHRQSGWTSRRGSGHQGGRRLPFDHKHRHAADSGVPYEFKDAHQLLSDFFVEVDAVLKEMKSK
jgi:hypothetical protein